MTLVKINNRRQMTHPFLGNALFSTLNESNSEAFVGKELPRVNISETEGNFIIQLAAPGLKRDDFQINLKKDVLTVSAEKEKEEATKFSRQEFDFGNFSRSFNLPEAADTENIKASYEDGILSITIDKRDETTLQRKITVS